MGKQYDESFIFLANGHVISVICCKTALLGDHEPFLAKHLWTMMFICYICIDVGSFGKKLEH